MSAITVNYLRSSFFHCLRGSSKFCSTENFIVWRQLVADPGVSIGDRPYFDLFTIKTVVHEIHDKIIDTVTVIRENEVDFILNIVRSQRKLHGCVIKIFRTISE